MGMLFLAGLNMAVFHLGAYRQIVVWDLNKSIPFSARVAGFSSMVLWILVIFFGRWIGFA